MIVIIFYFLDGQDLGIVHTTISQLAKSTKRVFRNHLEQCSKSIFSLTPYICTWTEVTCRATTALRSQVILDIFSSANYVLCIYLSSSLKLLFCVGFVRSYFSLSFYPINMEFGHHIPRVVIFCYDFSKSSIMFFRIYPEFSGSLYCSAKAKDSICSLVSEQILPFGLHDSRPIIGSNVGSMMYILGDSPFIA